MVSGTTCTADRSGNDGRRAQRGPGSRSGQYVSFEEYVAAPIPLVLGALAATVAWLSRPAWIQERIASRTSQVA